MLYHSSLTHLLCPLSFFLPVTACIDPGSICYITPYKLAARSGNAPEEFLYKREEENPPVTLVRVRG